jgi:hypothetical protein
MHKLALAGAAAAALLVAGTPALAFTHHPATPAEIQATDDLNAKSLADARAGAANQPTASVNSQTYMNNTTTATTPSPDASAPMPAPANPSANGNSTETPDANTAAPAPKPDQPEPPASGQ